MAWIALVGSMGVGILGGLIGLGGAEFRLPLLLALLCLPPLEAVVLNKAMSLIVVVSAFLFRANSVPIVHVLALWPVIVNVLAGSLVGAWIGASGAARLSAVVLRKVIAALLISMAGVLLWSSYLHAGSVVFNGTIQMVTGVLAGLGIGVVAAILGVAGGELIIPTVVVLFGVDIELAGSVSLAISFPTMIVGLIRYSADQRFSVLHTHRALVAIMAFGSLAGTFIGGHLLGVVPHRLLAPLLAAILLISATKIWHDGLVKERTT